MADDSAKARGFPSPSPETVEAIGNHFAEKYEAAKAAAAQSTEFWKRLASRGQRSPRLRPVRR